MLGFSQKPGVRECLHLWWGPWSSKPVAGLNKARSGFDSHTLPLSYLAKVYVESAFAFERPTRLPFRLPVTPTVTSAGQIGSREGEPRRGRSSIDISMSIRLRPLSLPYLQPGNIRQ